VAALGIILETYRKIVKNGIVLTDMLWLCISDVACKESRSLVSIGDGRT